MWIPYMQYFSTGGWPCYAVSYRGHVVSWYPSLLRMYFTTRGAVAEDPAAGIRYVEALDAKRRGESEKRERKAVLVAHSPGGALAQYVLSRGMVVVERFCMLAAVPGFGSWSCYKLWALTAPIHFPYRFFHPRYILATIPQVNDVFFTRGTTVSLVERFARLLSPYESMLWPMQTLFAFVTGPDVLSSITGWARRRSFLPSPSSPSTKTAAGLTQRLLILAAEKDVLCMPPSSKTPRSATNACSDT